MTAWKPTSGIEPKFPPFGLRVLVWFPLLQSYRIAARVEIDTTCNWAWFTDKGSFYPATQASHWARISKPK